MFNVSHKTTAHFKYMFITFTEKGQTYYHVVPYTQFRAVSHSMLLPCSNDNQSKLNLFILRYYTVFDLAIGHVL